MFNVESNRIYMADGNGRIVAEHVPAYWGIISVELIKGSVDFYRVREAAPNPKAKLQNKMSLLFL